MPKKTKLTPEAEAGIARIAALPELDIRRLIRRALDYRSGPDSVNTVYLGSMATHAVCRAIGARGYLSDAGLPLDEAIMAATREQLLVALRSCWSVIEHMQEYPMRVCECCGQVLPALRRQQPRIG